MYKHRNGILARNNRKFKRTCIQFLRNRY